MNILIDDLPCEIDGKRIKSDFRNMVLFELMMQDPTVPTDCKIPFAIDLLYAEPVETVESGVDGLLWFYSCGGPPEKNESGGVNTGKLERAYDFEQDAAYIYAAFLSVYNIDLNEIDYLHWWKFRAMFNALPDNCKISQIMSYRLIDTSKMNGQEKRFYERMKRLYKIKTVMHPEQLSLAAQEEKAKQHVNNRFAAAEAWAKGGGVPLKK